MLTKQQILDAEKAAEQADTSPSIPLPVERGEGGSLPRLAVTVELELASAQELGEAIQHLERGDRSQARQAIGRAVENLNEAEIED